MIVNSSNIVWLEEQPDESVHHIITDPPYLINFMNKGWDSKDNIAGRKDFWKECLRVLKPGGHLLVFGHSRTHHRVMTAIEDAGAEIRDCLFWFYGSGFPKSQDIGKKIDKLQGNKRVEVEHTGLGGGAYQKGNSKKNSKDASSYATGTSAKATRGNSEWEGWGNALKPAYEPIIMARKKFKGSLTNNVLEHGTGAINIDATRVGAEPIITNGKGNKWVESNPHGKRTGQSVLGVNKQNIGRHPANIMLTHSPGCRKVGETTEETLNHNAPAGSFAGGEEDRGSEKVYRKQQNKVELYECEDDCPINQLDKQAPKVGNAFKTKRKKDTTGGSGDSWSNGGKKEGQDNGTYDGLSGASRFFYQPKVSKKERNKGVNNNHPTIKPIELMKWLVKLVSKEGQVIYDPFAGSGTTGIACALLNRDFVGTELDPDYCDIAKKRIEWWKDNEG